MITSLSERTNPATQLIVRRMRFLQSTLDGNLPRELIDRKFAGLLWEETQAGLFDRSNDPMRHDSLEALMLLRKKALMQNGHPVNAQRPKHGRDKNFPIPNEHYRY